MLFLCDTNGDGVKEIIKDIPLVAQFTVEKNTVRQNVWQRFWQWLKGLFA
jgi:hypothetical protein